MRHLFISMLFVLSISHVPISAQQQVTITPHKALWVTMLNKISFTDHFFFANEFHLRRANLGGIPQQILERPSLNYQLANFVTASVGYSFIQNDPYSIFSPPTPTIEHNVWEQFELKHKIKHLVFKHRYRLEQRFINRVVSIDSSNIHYTDGFQFRHRFRYRLTATYTFKPFKNKSQKLFIHVFDELFLGLSTQGIAARLFNQNWIYLGIGYGFNKYGHIELGYMNQNLQRNSSNFEDNHIIQVTFRYNFDLQNLLKKKATNTN